MKKIFYDLFKGVVRLAAGVTFIMILLGALHRDVPAIPAWGWWTCLWATLIPLVVVRLIYFEVQDAKGTEG